MLISLLGRTRGCYCGIVFQGVETSVRRGTAQDSGSTSIDTAMPNNQAICADFIEAGAGPLVVLVHSSTSGARQWSALIAELQDRFRLRALNLFGYGGTPAWSGANPPSLASFASLVASIVPDTERNIHLVGHSFGGAVAMQAATCQLRGRVASLVLIEPSLFYLLDRCDRPEAFEEISTLAEYTKRRIADGAPEAAAERFIDYWCGAGTWLASSPERKLAFARAIAHLPNEFAAVLTGETLPAVWCEVLPRRTLIIACAKTTRPSREVVELLVDAQSHWEIARVSEAGHMAPLTHPQVVNPIIRRYLTYENRANIAGS